MNLFNTKTPIEPANPQVSDYIKQQQNNQELTLAENRNYILLTTCLFEAILNEYSNKLLPRDIIFFVQLLNLYNSALSKNQKSIIYASDKLAKLLGYNAQEKSNMRSIVLRIVKKLEQLGLLNVTRHKDKKGSDKVNEVVPILPDQLYAKLKYEPSNFTVDSRRLDGESNIQYIVRTKLFTPITLEFIKNLFDDSTITAIHKIFYLNCIITAYKNYQTTGKLSFSATSQELISKNNVSKRTLARILDYIKNQYPDYFIAVNHSYAKSDDIDSNRYDKSIFIISINPIVIPQSCLNKNNLEVQKAIAQTKAASEKVEYVGIDNAPLDTDNEIKKPDIYAGFQAGVPNKKPSSAKQEAHNNKDIIIKNKDIDYIDVNHLNFKNSSVNNSQDEFREPPTTKNTEINHKEEFLEDKQGLSSSKSYNNSSFLDVSSKNTVLKKKENQEVITAKSTKLLKPNQAPDKTQHLELRHFYPVSEKDVILLNSRAHREFSNNFVNQLLLKLYIKYPEKKFKNRFTFLSYMVQILANEKHQGPLVNHTSFRFSCNVGTEEKRILEYEKYLNQIEDSLDLSKEMCVKKKIAGWFSSEVAYKILTGVAFKTNAYNSFITALIPSHIALSERQIATLSEQLEAVFGINGYYVQELEKEVIQPPKSRTRDIDPKGKPIDILAEGSKVDTAKENTTWHQIRKSLGEEFGEAIDTVWFSKAKAIECRETSLLLLTMPTRFMADWVRNNYSHAIRRLAGSVGVKMVEYEYEQNNRV